MSLTKHPLFQFSGINQWCEF